MLGVLAVGTVSFVAWIFLQMLIFVPQGREEFRNTVVQMNIERGGLEKAKEGVSLTLPVSGITLWLETIGGGYLVLKSTRSCPPCPLTAELKKHVLVWPPFSLRDYKSFDLLPQGIPVTLYVTESDGREIEYVAIPSTPQ